MVSKPDPKNGRAKNAVLRFLNARVSLPSWMLALSSTALSLIAIGLILFGSGLGTFGAALLFNGALWASLLAIGSTATVIGLIVKRAWLLLRWGAFLSFLMWIFGGLAFILSGQAITTFVVVLPWLLFYMYVYLASHFRDETGI